MKMIFGHLLKLKFLEVPCYNYFSAAVLIKLLVFRHPSFMSCKQIITHGGNIIHG